MTKFPDPDSENRASRTEIYNPSDTALPFRESDVHLIIKNIEQEEQVRFSSIEIVFTDEEGIVDINKTYLDRDYVTDIISFRLDDDDTGQMIEGTLYCCAPRIIEQSSEFETEQESEFLRVIIHGLLHLTGYNDKSEMEKETMTKLENHYLSQIKP